jgi:hypothetical protein
VTALLSILGLLALATSPSSAASDPRRYDVSTQSLPVEFIGMNDNDDANYYDDVVELYGSLGAWQEWGGWSDDSHHLTTAAWKGAPGTSGRIIGDCNGWRACWRILHSGKVYPVATIGSGCGEVPSCSHTFAGSLGAGFYEDQATSRSNNDTLTMPSMEVGHVFHVTTNIVGPR